MKVLGVQVVDYKNKDGKHVEGIVVHYEYNSQRIDGVGCDNCFLGKALIEHAGGQIPAPGDELFLTYNRRGKVNGYNIGHKD